MLKNSLDKEIFFPNKLIMNISTIDWLTIEKAKYK